MITFIVTLAGILLACTIVSCVWLGTISYLQDKSIVGVLSTVFLTLFFGTMLYTLIHSHFLGG